MIHPLSVVLCVSLLSVVVVGDGSEMVNPSEPRMCYTCAGSTCQRPSQTTVQSQCNDVLDYCVTVFDAYAVQAKGCYSEMPETMRRLCDMKDNPECYKCFGQLCNNKGREDLKCIICDSNDDKSCGTDTSSMHGMQCDIPTAMNTYCYVRTSDKGVVKRGCLVHQKEQSDCQTDTSCSLCLPSDSSECNSYNLNIKSGGSRASLWLMPSIVVMAAVLILKGAI